MTELTPIAAFLAGLAGSGHCLGMCGGIAALGMAGKDRTAGLRAVLYSLGRIASYAVMGAAGAGVLGLIVQQGEFFEWGRYIRDALALVTITLGLLLMLRERWLSVVSGWGSRFWGRIKPLMGGLMPADRWYKSLALGALWGWLPCGLVYAMLSIAWLSSEPLQGAAIMASFGLGTLPAMVGVSITGTALFPRLFGQRPGRAKAILRLAAGAMLIISGAIMFAMPRMSSDSGNGHSNHQAMATAASSSP